MSDIGLFDLAEQRLEWIDARQSRLAQNIANIDTPNYRPRDLAPFRTLLDDIATTPVRTNPLHLAGLSGTIPEAASLPGASAPDGNEVGLEDQMTKVADDEGAQALVGNLWKSYMGMFMTALGHG
jgi:flagellar basal-body rod protein FlgB